MIAVDAKKAIDEMRHVGLAQISRGNFSAKKSQSSSPAKACLR
jgi:hypothetical protein